MSPSATKIVIKLPTPATNPQLEGPKNLAAKTVKIIPKTEEIRLPTKTTELSFIVAENNNLFAFVITTFYLLCIKKLLSNSIWKVQKNIFPSELDLAP